MEPVTTDIQTPLKEWIQSHRKPDDYRRAFRDGLDLTRAMAIQDETDCPDVDLWCSAIAAFIGIAEHLPAPLVHPLQQGGVSVEWHAEGLNVEARFREGDYVFVVVEDARSVVSEFYGADPELSRAKEALAELARRVA